MLNDWSSFFDKVENKTYFKSLKLFLDEEYSNHVIYPPREKIFNAFNLTSPNSIKVVLIGQDPYHEINQAMGLSFSVPRGTKLPPSLIKIYKEIENDLGVSMDFSDGDLTYLAKQGVLLLTTILTVRKSIPLSHQNIGYDLFVQDILKTIDEQNQPIVFLLWGNYARGLKKYLHNPNHLILESTHPSPLSANRGGFFNQNHFLKTNNYLVSHELTPINWQN